MIQSLTYAIKESWILKGFLGVLMISFAVWGVGDAITPAVDPNIVIKIDQVEVRTDELQRRFSMEVDQLRDAVGMDFTARDAADLGVMDNLVAQLSQQAALDMAARQMGVTVPDETLRRAILEQDAFVDETGNFSRIMLNQVLASNSLTEQGFVDILRSDVTRQFMLRPVATSSGAPEVMVDALFRYRAEQRVADVLYIADETVELPGEPTETDLQQVYNENIDNFTAPEYRSVEAILIRPTDLIPADSITEEEIQTFYDENIDRYRTQPTRTVRQIIFPTQMDAQAAYDTLQGSDSLVELGERTGMGAPIDLGEIRANESLGFDLSAIFDLTQRGITEPVQSDFGWHLFEVTDLTVGSISALPVVRQEIIDFIVADRAFDEIFEATIFLEDQLAGGVSMTEIAETPGYNRIYFESVDRDGRNPIGSPLTFPVEQERFLRLAFSTAPGLESQLVETDDYAYILRTISVTEPAPKPYALVEADVRELWEAQTRSAATRARASELVNEIGPSVALPNLADGAEDVEFANLGPITRFGNSLRIDNIIATRLVSPDLMDQLFQADIGDVVQARVGAGHVVARLKEILPPEGADLAQVREQVVSAVTQALADDLVAGFTDAMTREFDVVINREAIDQLIPQQQ